MGRGERLNPNAPRPFPEMKIPIIGATPPARVLDQLGRALEVGDAVLLPQNASVWQIESIEKLEPQPNEPPHPPSGIYGVMVSCRLRLDAMPNLPIKEIVRVALAKDVRETL
jgi:hypothetical protein